MKLKCTALGSNVITAKPSQRGNDDSEVLKFKDFQGPLTSNSKTFKALFHFSRTFQVLEKWEKNFKDFQELSRPCGHLAYKMSCYVTQPTATELFQSPPFGSGTVFRSMSHPCRHFPSSALAWRHASSNCVIHNTFVVPAKWHRHFGHVNRFYLLTYFP